MYQREERDDTSASTQIFEFKEVKNMLKARMDTNHIIIICEYACVG